MNEPLVGIIILNWNQRDLTLDCLDSVARLDYPAQCLRIIVVDNGSTDSSARAIRGNYPAVTVIETGENLGYAGGNNVGIRHALEQVPDYLLILNNDTLADPNLLIDLVRVVQVESDARVGVVGPMVYHHGLPQSIQSAGGMMDRHWRASHRGENQPDTGQFLAADPHVDWLSGCALLINRQALDEIGLLDERFFSYWEEVEWCMRARLQQWRILFAPQAKIWHKGVQPDYQPSPRVAYYMTRNRFLLLKKHHAPLSAWVVAGYETLRPILSWSLKSKWRTKRAHRDAMLRGIQDFLLSRWGPENYHF